MDIITLLGIIGSVLTIISSLIAIFSTSSQNSFFNKNNININNSRNLNSNNSTVNNFISNTQTKHYHTYTTYYDNSSNNYGIILIFSLIFGGLIANIYLKYLNQTLLYLTIFLILSFVISLISLLILTMKNLITRKNLNIYILMWFPLFFMLIFIQNHFFKSNNLDVVEKTLKSSITFPNFINTFFSYKLEVGFISLQIVGLAAIALIAFFTLLKMLKQLYKGLKFNKISNVAKTKDILLYVFYLVFIFLLISGYGIVLIYKLNLYINC
ncbi:TPA: hypothetical protein ACX96U_002459 [Clostridium sporogenes]|nr:hypothetical protein [Clostridium botulinum]